MLGFPIASGSSLSGLGEEGVGVVAEELGSEEELRLEKQGGRDQERNKDVLPPNRRKPTDRGRVMGHEFGLSAEGDALRPPS